MKLLYALPIAALLAGAGAAMATTPPASGTGASTAATTAPAKPAKATKTSTTKSTKSKTTANSSKPAATTNQ